MANIIVTGGSGKLGSEIKKNRPKFLYPARDEFDITSTSKIENFLDRNPQVDTVIHCAALVSPPIVNETPELAVITNIIGTSNLSVICFKRKIKLIYISTDYVFSGKKGNYLEDDELLPTNKYAWSKLGGECAIRMLDKYAIIRLSFGPDIFPYDAAFIDQYTSREPASVIAKKILMIVESNFNGVIHIGGKRKTVYDYALSLGANNINKISIKDMKVQMPTDTSLDCTKFNNL
jgi:dTDP-4-dehydrorhamnose reductase